MGLAIGAARPVVRLGSEREYVGGNALDFDDAVSSANDSVAGVLYLSLDDDALVAQCKVDVYRASGPGGQKRNKTCSAVRLRHTPTGLMANAVEDRSQHVNKRRAIRRLRETIALHARRHIDPVGYTPSDRLQSYVNATGQLRINDHNIDYPLVLSEVLDVFVACHARVSDTAASLQLTTAHLVGFLKRQPKLWKLANELRKAAGEKPLR